MEILAPAGNFESLCAAVCSGADAVYFGAGGFNARRNAQNFTEEDIFGAVEYCHVRGVLAYLTLNTLVSDYEMKDALSLAKTACKAGIDGIIIQDIGLAEIIKAAAPDMPLHASTQMSVHSKSGVKFLHEHGYKRIVLSREVSRKELLDISEYANAHGIELEIFVQGALCMSVSGQCLFSALLGGRSGNRGLCAGTCRLPFRVDNGNGYDLSLKDLNLYEHFGEFEKMGISSLKIEGRMKRPEYVAMAVNAAVAAKQGYSDLADKIDNLQKIFSRSGFTDGYYEGKIDKDMFGIRSEKDVDNSKEIKNAAHELYRREYPHVGVNMKLFARFGEKTKLEIDDGENHAIILGDEPQKAINRSLDYDFAKSKLEKCGGTPFYLESLVCDIDEGVSVPSGELNRLKNEATGELLRRRSAVKPKAWSDKLCDDMTKIGAKENMPKKHKLIGVFCDIDTIPETEALSIYVVPMNSDDDKIGRLINSGKTVAVSTPRYITDEQAVSRRLCELKKIGVELAYIQNLGAIELSQNAGMKIISGGGLNVYNSYTADSEMLKSSEIITLSYELSTGAVQKIMTHHKTCVNAYGRLPLMIIHNCPRKAHNGCKNCDGKIVDRKGVEFHLQCVDGVTHLFSDRPLYMADRTSEINADYLALQFTTEDKNEALNIIHAFENGLSPTGLYTRGMYQKGVL